MLDTAILGLLTEGESHGYGIRARLRDMGFWRISFGSVYPALARLQRLNAIESREKDSKGRKLHKLTRSGRDLLNAQMTDVDSIDNSSAFRVRLTFLELLPTDQRIEVLAQRRHVLIERIAAVDAASEQSRYARAEKEHRVEMMEQDVAWLQGLIDTEGTT